jgi:hypothetical protein
VRRCPVTPAAATESAFVRQVLQLAHLFRWRAVHFRPARTARGWRTAVQGDGVGFVDVILCRERVVFAELKTDRGRLRPEQIEWISALRVTGQEVYVWRPSMWDQIAEVLR